MSGEAAAILRKIPQVDRLLTLEEFQPLITEHSRAVVVRNLRDHLDSLRKRALAGKATAADLKTSRIRDAVAADLKKSAHPYYCRVINATGVVLHTGLGRAPLAQAAVDSLKEHAGHPVRVEIDLESGERGGRDEGCAQLLRTLTGAEAATVVNNNAGATLLILAAMARGKKVLLSHGEMVEIGGSFRVPEVMEESGAILAAIGTTNRTHARDYRRAADADTGMILKVHTSNYRIEGFTSEVEIEELVTIGRELALPVVHDLGSGCLFNLAPHGFTEEPPILRSVAAGADLICFSGDKLLGGPQAGIIIGKRAAVERCAKHPLYRALRPGRLTYLALEATLRIYLQGEEEILRQIPSMGRLLADPAKLKQRAQRLMKKLAQFEGYGWKVASESSQAGSGALPARDLPTWAVRITPRGAGLSGAAAQELSAKLRDGDTPILARIRDGAVILDLRTIEDSEFALIEERFRAISG